MSNPIDDTVDKMCKMWHIVQALNKTEWFRKDYKDKLSHFQDSTFGDLCTKYIIPVRYMLNYGEFEPKSFRRYLQRLDKPGYKSQDEWCERQADYVRFLYQYYNPHAPQNHIHEVWQKARADMIQEFKNFKQDFEEAKSVVDKRQAELLNERKELLKALLRGGVKPLPQPTP